MYIRETLASDLEDVLRVERNAFGRDKEPDMVRIILNDSSAEPILSLMAYEGRRAVGHILFTTAHLTNGGRVASVAFLSTLAVVFDAQRRGIGGKLIEKGLHILSRAGVDLVFVLGHPDYYPRHGFTPASRLGLETPHPIPERVADAWMVNALTPGVIGTVSGKVVCCDALDRPELWRG